jgi:FKBP-type peptidyl-prolyl cis-trans isomerase 2
MVRLWATGLVAFVGAKVENRGGVEVDTYFEPEDCESATHVAQPGAYVSIHYVGTIDSSSATGEPGKQFDSTRDRSQPYNFQLGQNEVIAGFDRGLMSMCPGTKARLTVAPDLAYGDGGVDQGPMQIPGGATLSLDIELIEVSPDPIDKVQPNLFKQIDADGDNKITKEEMKNWFKETRVSNECELSVYEMQTICRSIFPAHTY